MSDAATVDTVDVVPAAVRILVSELSPTDRVFTAMGEPRALAYVTHYTRGVMFRREDAPRGTFEWWDYEDVTGAPATATVIRRASMVR